jgi:protein-S-isoprenylcysteine O-methyltransferase Ste14
MQIHIKPLVVQSLGFFGIFALALFLPADTISWFAGWIFLVLFFGFFVAANLWLSRYNPGLFQERMRLSRPDQKGWDKILYPLLLVFSLVWLIFMSFDAVRFHWSPVPIWLQIIGQ